MNQNYTELYRKALSANGDDYLRLRDQLVAGKADSLKLHIMVTDSGWQSDLLDAILSCHTKDANECTHTQDIARGTAPSLTPERYNSGSPPVHVCADSLLKRGSTWSPVLLEMLFKFSRSLNSFTLSVINNVVIAWNDSRAIPVYRTMVFNKALPGELRALAVKPIKRLGSTQLVQDMHMVWQDEENPATLRKIALVTLGETKDPSSVEMLQKMLSDTAGELTYRSAAATGLGASGNVPAIDTLSRIFEETSEHELRLAIINALGLTGSQKAHEVLTGWKKDSDYTRYYKKIDNALLRIDLAEENKDATHK